MTKDEMMNELGLMGEKNEMVNVGEVSGMDQIRLSLYQSQHST